MNPELKRTINTLRAASRKGGKPIWAALADELDKPKRKRNAVNLSRIGRHTGPGDVVAVAGRLGWAGAGLAVLTRGFRSPGTVVNAHRVPEPPYAAGPAAAKAGATSMIDVSDGLLADLGHIARVSGVLVDLRSEALEVPARLVDVGSALGVDPLHWLLTGGEDHALVATFPPGTALPEGWREIGVAAAGEPVVLVDGRTYEGDQGWDHFAGR